MSYMGGFPKIWGTLLGVPIVRTIVYWGLYWGSLILGNGHTPEPPKVCERIALWAVFEGSGAIILPTSGA